MRTVRNVIFGLFAVAILVSSKWGLATQATATMVPCNNHAACMSFNDCSPSGSRNCKCNGSPGQCYPHS